MEDGEIYVSGRVAQRIRKLLVPSILFSATSVPTEFLPGKFEISKNGF
jgi:hypothetical protein